MCNREVDLWMYTLGVCFRALSFRRSKDIERRCTWRYTQMCNREVHLWMYTLGVCFRALSFTLLLFQAQIQFLLVDFQFGVGCEEHVQSFFS
jgi:hypothetical protein